MRSLLFLLETFSRIESSRSLATIGKFHHATGSSHSGSSGVSSFVQSATRKSGRISWKIFKWACFIYCFTNYVADIFVCIGSSMEPTIHSHDIVLTEHLTQSFGKLKKGDVVIARSPSDPSTIICKRIAGEFGDLVSDDHGVLNKVPRGHVWLEGDNPVDSFDSRRYGAVAEGLILSKVFCRIWPFDRFGFLSERNRKSLKEENFDLDPENSFSGGTLKTSPSSH